MTQDPSTLADAPPQPFRCDILTLFPALFAGVRTEGLLGKAIEDGLVELNLHNWRDWTHDRHRLVAEPQNELVGEDLECGDLGQLLVGPIG